MARYKPSRIIPVALVLIIVAIAIAALVSLARAVFFSSPTSTTVTQVDESRAALLNTSADRSVQMTVRGAIVANENFRSYRVTVSPTNRSLVVYTGYVDKKIDEVSLGNNIPAYEQLVFALERANMVKGTELAGDKNDLRGICATGIVYEFQTLSSGTPTKSLWTSTCKGSPGSLDASVNQLSNLFIRQIPDGLSLVRAIDL